MIGPCSADERWIDGLCFDDAGLVPVVVVDTAGARVLMLAYASREALALSARTREAWFFSRSRQRLWKKGETSGNTMEVLSITVDCDSDAVLYEVKPSGPACHTGARSCFFNVVAGRPEPAQPVQGQPDQSQPDQSRLGILDEIDQVIDARKRLMPEGSYVAQLLKGGPPAVARKVGEEATETLVAGLSESPARLVSEVADLIFHSLVLLASRGKSLWDVVEELRKRRKP